MTSNTAKDFIAAALRRQTEEHRDYLVCSRDDVNDYYVQFPHPGERPTTLYGEAVSDVSLPQDLALGEAGAATLRGLGWNAPTADATTRITGWDSRRNTWITPNWFQEFQLEDSGGYDAIAKTIVETLRSVYRFSDGRLTVELGASTESSALVGVFDTADASETWAEIAEVAASPSRRLTADEDEDP